VKHLFVANWVYNLPFGKGKQLLSNVPAFANYIVGGWQVTGISTMRTGTPYSITYTSSLVGFATSGRANVVGDWHLSNPGVNGWFNPAAFAAPAPFTLGNVGRNSMWAPGFWNFDMGFMKNIQFRDRYNLQLRGELYNLFNHPNPSGPNVNLSVPTTFGKTTTFSAARVVSFGLKFAF
jgi:hypothetical protein